MSVRGANPDASGAFMRFATERICAARALVRAIHAEFRWLNSGRIGADTLARLDPDERVRAVKAALLAHHRNSNRCC
jgi:hypothetical protein